MSLLVKALNYVHPDNALLFDDLSFVLNDGEKVALIGINGCGKSTLLKLVAGKLQPSSGEIRSSKTPWYVPQHLGDYDTWTIAQALQVDRKLHALNAILGGNTDSAHFDVLDEDWEIESKVETALAQWGLDGIRMDRVLGSLSGGQKTRVFLAALDLNKPDFILLDEPSNHLDLPTRTKLYNVIQQSKATMLIVSHDRTLLSLMNKTMELSKNGIELFGGNFEFYRQKKLEKVNALNAQLNERSKSLKESERKARDMAVLRAGQEAKGKSTGMSNSIPRIIAGGLKSKAQRTTAKVLHAHNEKIAGLVDDIKETKAQIQLYEPLKIEIPAATIHQGKLLIKADNINFSYGTTPLWHDLSFEINSGARVQIEGGNGAGKTTLLKIITNELKPARGAYYATAFSYIYLDQEYAMIDPKLSIYELLERHNKRGLDEHELKSILFKAQFDRDAFDRKCAGLSGGEKMKLSLCLITLRSAPADMLILDEPTNNLDVQSLEVLTFAVKNFGGTLLVISHDVQFITEIGINQKINLV